MIYREALITDIPQIQIVRNSVKENKLSNPALVPDTDVEDYILNRGKGWVCEINKTIAGFAIVSITDQNVWALFVHPDHEGGGIGKQLHKMMMDWYFEQTDKDVWLSTSPGTKAEQFYRKAGWHESGLYGKGEIKFVLTAADWKYRRSEVK